MITFNNIKQQIITKIESLFLLALFLFWVSVFLYFRFIKVKVSYNLMELKLQITEYIVISNIFFIILHFILILYALYLIVIKRRKTYIAGIIKDTMNLLFVKPFLKVRDLIAPHIPYSGLLFCYFTEYLEKQSLTTLKILVIIFNSLPRIIVALIFFIEIIFYNQIYYFLISIFLLLVPILWNIFVNLYVNFAERGLLQIPKYIEITPIGEPLPNGWYTNYSFRPLNKYHYDPNDVKEYGETFIIVMKAYSFGTGKQSFNSFQQLITPYVTLLTSSLYLSASIYKLNFILF